MKNRLNDETIATIGLFLTEKNDDHMENLFKILYLLHPSWYNRHVFLTEIMDEDFKEEATDIIIDIIGGKKNNDRLFLTDNKHKILGLSYHVSIFREKIDYGYDNNDDKKQTNIKFRKGMRILNHKKIKNLNERIERTLNERQ